MGSGELREAGMAQGYGDSLRLHRDSILVRARFSSLVLTGSGSHPASSTMDAGRGFDQPPLSSAEVKERVEIYLYSPFGPSWPVLG